MGKPPYLVLQLYSSLVHENIDIVRDSLLAGVSVHSTFQGKRPLMFVLDYRKKASFTRLLLEHGADPEARSAQGRTALGVASANCDLDNMRVLIEWGAHLDHLDATGRTPLSCAISSTFFVDHTPQAVLLLLQAGANVNHGTSPLDFWSTHYGTQPEIGAMLLAAGAEWQQKQFDMKGCPDLPKTAPWVTLRRLWQNGKISRDMLEWAEAKKKERLMLLQKSSSMLEAGLPPELSHLVMTMTFGADVSTA